MIPDWLVFGVLFGTGALCIVGSLATVVLALPLRRPRFRLGFWAGIALSGACVAIAWRAGVLP